MEKPDYHGADQAGSYKNGSTKTQQNNPNSNNQEHKYEECHQKQTSTAQE
jgi:hypothetical protein